MSVRMLETQCVHRTHRDANAATDARAGGIVQYLLLERVAHHVDADLAIARTFVTADAFIVRDDFEFADFQFREQMRLQMHQFREGTPITAPNFSA